VHHSTHTPIFLQLLLNLKFRVGYSKNTLFSPVMAKLIYTRVLLSMPSQGKTNADNHEPSKNKLIELGTVIPAANQPHYFKLPLNCVPLYETKKAHRRPQNKWYKTLYFHL
jgi:hypothetical protein